MQPAQKRESIIGLIGILCLAGVIVLYYVSHKPFSPEVAVGIVAITWRMAVAGAIAAAAGGLGERLLGPITQNPLERIGLQFAIGLGAFGLLLLVISALAMNMWVAVILLVLAWILLWKNILRWLRDWRNLSSLLYNVGKLRKIGLAFVFILLLSTWIAALAPPIKFDALVYHLTLPRLYLLAGRLEYVPQLMYWGMPQIGEMLFTWATALGGAQAAAGFGWIIGLVALVSLFGTVQQRLGEKPAMLAAGTLLAGASLTASLSWAYVDWLTILYGVAFLSAFDAWRTDGNPRKIVLAGLLTGFALGTKYSAGILLVAGGVFVLAYSWKRFPLRTALVSLLTFGLSALLTFLPWLVKNFLATGNPVYPLAFPAGEMSALRLHLYQNDSIWGGIWDWLILPLRATYLGIEGGQGYSASVGPLLLGFGLSAFFGWRLFTTRQRQALLLPMCVALTVLALWTVLGRMTVYLVQSRLYYAGFPALTVLSGAGYVALRRVHFPGIRLGRLAVLMALMVLGLTTFEMSALSLSQGALLNVLGMRSNQAYLKDNLGWYGPAMEAVRSLPAGSMILMLYEPRSFYCTPACYPDEILDRWLRDRYDGHEEQPAFSDAILASWQAQGYTHLLYHKAGAEFERNDNQHYRPEDWEELEAMLAHLQPLTAFGEAYILYDLQP